PPSFRAALAEGTRSPDGSPGPNYWQQRSNYQIEARLDPASARVTGRGVVRYTNASPDTLRVLALHPYQNLHAPGVVRNEAQEVTGGIELGVVRVNGRLAPPAEEAFGAPAYQVEGTILVVAPPAPLAPGASVDLELD